MELLLSQISQLSQFSLFSQRLIPLIPIVYLSVLSVISLYGFHKVLMIYRFYKYKSARIKPAYQFDRDQLPTVTVQLPIFNELYVVERLLEAIAQLDYPKDKLEIQVLDDSTDETQQLCREKVKALKQQNFNIVHLGDRTEKASKQGR